ncbi:MAG: bifunctional folylpolyglutamate synthase/dihydrofolate synthase [Sporomusaceae bacterium]|nr:bifunctional folylpolyglutamate synthase/dihydrofolate synthase [Sporomusaceae bacterium]
MTYEQSLDYLDNLCKFGINLGLARIEKLLELMGHPEKQFKTIHITGTNGKGSTTAMLASILKAAGIKTGMYTSPHLSEYTERMMIDGQEISPDQFAEAVLHTSQFVEAITAQGLDHPTEFEILTAAAFHYFAACGVEYAIIEVGLGGLLDSTNVIMPEVAVITNVTLDHIDKCGITISEIAVHKAGIIKQGVPVVTAAKGQGLDIIKQTAQDKSAKIYVYDEDFSAQFAGRIEHRQRVEVQAREQRMAETFTVNLLGYHQVDNCAVAVMTALVLAEKEQRITGSALQQGLLQVCWPGRFEVIPGHPTIIIDGAHNQDGAKGLRRNLNEFYGNQDIVFLLGILRDKDVTSIVRELINADDQVVVVAPMSGRAGHPQEIAREIQAVHVETADSIANGLEQAYRLAGDKGVLCIAGSLYLIGTAREIICK